METLQELLLNIECRINALGANIEALRSEIRAGGRWLTKAQAAESLGVSLRTIDRKVQSRELHRKGDRYWVGESAPPKQGRPKNDGRYPL